MVTLRPIDPTNWRACVALQVREDQKKFVATNAYSLAQASYEKYCRPEAIFAGDDMVGFIMWCIDPDDSNYWIYRLMIDEKHQGNGYARQALQLVIERMKLEGQAPEIWIGYEPTNQRARELYLSLGFVSSGLASWGEELLKYSIEAAEEMHIPKRSS